MIDEELYQQAADELNSDRRRQHIWARACALASDDHDEARFLYTNLRVEELIAERENAASAGTKDAAFDTPDLPDRTLALTPLELSGDDDELNFKDPAPSDEFSLNDAHSDIPSSVSAPSGMDGGLRDDILQMAADEPDTANKELGDLYAVELDPDLMADYVPEPTGIRDDTYAGDAIGEDEFAMELESFKAEESSAHELLDIDSDVEEDALDETHLDLDGTASLELSDDEMADLVADRGDGDASIETADFTQDEPMADMTQANMVVLDAQTNELDAMLENANYEPEPPAAPVDDMKWLDNEPDELNASRPTIDEAEETVVYEADPYRDELNRQADELDLGDTHDHSADLSEKIADELGRDDTFPDAFKLPETSDDLSTDHPVGPDPSEERESAGDAIAASTSVAAAAALAASTAAASTGAASTAFASNMADDTGVSDTAGVNKLASAPDMSSPGHAIQSHTDEDDAAGFPLDLTHGRKGSEFSIYQRNTNAQAVKNGVSWSALFLTLPYLVYRHLFGTALAYIAVWIVAVGGLVISGLAWLDATADTTTAVAPLIQACTIGFALLCFIALIYLPFRHANKWRSGKLENRGFELVAVTKARNPGKAIARARRNAALNSSA